MALAVGSALTPRQHHLQAVVVGWIVAARDHHARTGCGVPGAWRNTGPASRTIADVDDIDAGCLDAIRQIICWRRLGDRTACRRHRSRTSFLIDSAAASLADRLVRSCRPDVLGQDCPVDDAADVVGLKDGGIDHERCGDENWRRGLLECGRSLAARSRRFRQPCCYGLPPRHAPGPSAAHGRLKKPRSERSTTCWTPSHDVSGATVPPVQTHTEAASMKQPRYVSGQCRCYHRPGSAGRVVHVAVGRGHVDVGTGVGRSRGRGIVQSVSDETSRPMDHVMESGGALRFSDGDMSRAHCVRAPD